MIWLASYPRSGNTFFRIVLKEVYGVESSAYHLDSKRPLDQDYAKYPVVKTHLLPSELKPADQSIPAVYLIRDGRDALVSMARKRENIIKPGSDYVSNLEEAIRAEGGAFFGGWSKHVDEWLERAQVVIRFEDLISDPIGQVERIRPLLDMPEPNVSKLPAFDELRKNNYEFRGGAKPVWHKDAARRENFFRRGKVGSWQDEMPDDLHALFWRLHGRMMEKMGYGAGEKPKNCVLAVQKLNVKLYATMFKRLIRRIVNQ